MKYIPGMCLIGLLMLRAKAAVMKCVHPQHSELTLQDPPHCNDLFHHHESKPI